MDHVIIINKKGQTDLRHLKNQHAVVKHLEVNGKGKLGGCLLTFSNEGDHSSGQKDLLFLKPTNRKTELLLPSDPKMTVSQYDFCCILIFTGNLHEEDEVTLHLSTQP